MGHRFAALASAVLLALGGSIDAAAGPHGQDPPISSLPATAGPDLLREPIATAPPLTNAPASGWDAPAILVSGAVAYDDGELLYQDFLFDDHGADGVRDPLQPQPFGVAVPIGTYTYPTGEKYHGNDADLVELRIEPGKHETRFRVTLNTLVDPELVGFTIALGDADSPVTDYPFGANVHGPSDVFLTVHGTTASSGSWAGEAVVDLERQQLSVALPHAVWDPGRDAVTVAAGVGLWDVANGRYLVPGVMTTETAPGGAGTISDPPAFFNVAFRTTEPIGGTNRYWSNAKQAAALAAHDMTEFTFPVDFDRLERRDDDVSGVPTTGSIDRIMSSHFDVGVGVDLGVSCNIGTVRHCTGQMLTRLQPYNLYVPQLADGADRYGLTVLLHSLNANHNQYAGTKNQSQYGRRDQGTLVMTPMARGNDGQYYEAALADVFEVWADVAAHYPLEAAFTSIAGYSMGGYGTFKLAMAYPDLFARGHATVGSAYPHEMRMPSLRNVPMLMWNALADELVPVAEPELDFEEAARFGIRLELDLFETSDHLLLAVNDEYGPGAAFLGDHRVEENPSFVTYIVNPIDHLEHMPLRLNADHAYWLSDMTVRVVGDDTGGRDTFSDGRVDAHTHAFGEGDPVRLPPGAGFGVLEGGAVPALPYTRQILEWGATPAITVADRLDLTLTNLATTTVDMARAGLSCSADVRVTTDGPVTVTFAGCDRVATYDAVATAHGAPDLGVPWSPRGESNS